jgi:hypothetical protein
MVSGWRFQWRNNGSARNSTNNRRITCSRRDQRHRQLQSLRSGSSRQSPGHHAQGQGAQVQTASAHSNPPRKGLAISMVSSCAKECAAHKRRCPSKELPIEVATQATADQPLAAWLLPSGRPMCKSHTLADASADQQTARTTRGWVGASVASPGQQRTNAGNSNASQAQSTGAGCKLVVRRRPVNT